MVVTSYLLPEGGTEQTITAPESSGNAFSVPNERLFTIFAK
jgi:hypothetical protein